MEKQKIFWVILSVTVFVVVVLVVGVFLLKKEPTAIASTPTTPKAGGSLFEFGRDVGSAEGDTEVLRFVIGGDETAGNASAETPAEGATVAGAAPEGASGAVAEPPSVPPAAAAKPAATTAKPVATAKPAAAKPSAKPAGAGVEYWIQTGSYKSQSRAEELSEALSAKGLAGRVFSFAGTEATYFRVRIGPYDDRQEAEKFLAIVRKLQGLEASYISQVAPSRATN